MKLRSLLLLALRRPRAAAASLALLAALPLGGALVRWHHGQATTEPRALLNRLWLDRMPDKRSDDIELWLWFGGGVGIHEKGSSFRNTYETVDFERQGDRLAVTFLQDKRKVSTRFTIEPCDEQPPFDLCLTFDNPPAGPKRLYGFAYDDDEERLSWARALRRAAEARAALRD